MEPDNFIWSFEEWQMRASTLTAEDRAVIKIIYEDGEYILPLIYHDGFLHNERLVIPYDYDDLPEYFRENYGIGYNNYLSLDLDLMHADGIEFLFRGLQRNRPSANSIVTILAKLNLKEDGTSIEAQPEQAEVEPSPLPIASADGISS